MKKSLIAVMLVFSALTGFAHKKTKPDLRYRTHADSTTNRKAPDFQLKDLTGKTISLEDYKGKVLILDFWATWCAPCRESFPAVQKVVETYANDPAVAFLFIDTKERVDNYPKLVNEFLAKKKYPFHVVFDDKGSDGKMDVTFKKYMMPGIPSKYFIDPNGIIRFNTLGFKPGQTMEEAVNEIIDLVEKTKTWR